MVLRVPSCINIVSTYVSCTSYKVPLSGCKINKQSEISRRKNSFGTKCKLSIITVYHRLLVLKSYNTAYQTLINAVTYKTMSKELTLGEPVK